MNVTITVDAFFTLVLPNIIIRKQQIKAFSGIDTGNKYVCTEIERA